MIGGICPRTIAAMVRTVVIGTKRNPFPYFGIGLPVITAV